MAKARECLSKPKKGDDRWAVKVLVGLAVTAVGSGFFLLRFGSEVPTGYKAATNGPLVRKENRPTLSPARFIGKAARAHEIAREIPDVLDQLRCYCACDKHLNHKSLLSCYTDGHAGT